MAAPTENNPTRERQREREASFVPFICTTHVSKSNRKSTIIHFVRNTGVLMFLSGPTADVGCAAIRNCVSSTVFAVHLVGWLAGWAEQIEG